MNLTYQDDSGKAKDDGPFDVALPLDERDLRKKNEITLINTYARSLTPKIDSLIDCFTEREVDIAVLTETWLRDGEELQANLLDLEQGAGISTLTLNRPPHPTTGVCHGGVAIMLKKTIGSFKTVSYTHLTLPTTPYV